MNQPKAMSASLSAGASLTRPVPQRRPALQPLLDPRLGPLALRLVEGAALDAFRADPAKGAIDYVSLPDTELAAIARGREALAVFGWKPYMHNPRLKRWLHRIDIPTRLIWGQQDGIVTTSYAGGWQAEIPGATLETIPAAGHYPHWEQPDAFADRVAAFAAQL